MILDQSLELIDITENATLASPVRFDRQGILRPLILHADERVLQRHFLSGRIADDFDFLQILVELQRKELLERGSRFRT